MTHLKTGDKNSGHLTRCIYSQRLPLLDYYLLLKFNKSLFIYLYIYLLFLSLDWSGILVNITGEIFLYPSHHQSLCSCTHRFTHTCTHRCRVTSFSSLPPSQTVNFALVPPVARTVFLGGVALLFTIYLCHLRQQRGHKLK